MMITLKLYYICWNKYVLECVLENPGFNNKAIVPRRLPRNFAYAAYDAWAEKINVSIVQKVPKS